MTTRSAPLLLLFALFGCGASTGVVAPPRALAYAVPTPAVVEYVSGDSARIQIDAGGQRFAVRAEVAERWRMAFEAAPQGTRVTATLIDLDARVTNPMSAPATADESTVQGPVVFTLDARGRATVERVPTIKPVVAQFLNGYGVAQGFFPRLPGRSLAAGASWTDTVSYETEESGAKTTVESVTTYTPAGDSVDGGVTYLLVRTSGTTRQSSVGTLAGTQFEQAVSGSTSGHFLWDGAAGILQELVYRSELTGTMEVAIAPVPLAVTVTSTIRERRASP